MAHRTDASPPISAASAADPTRRLQRVLVLAASLALLLVWSGLLLILESRRQAAIDAEVRQNTNLARVLAEQSERLLQTLQHATQRVRDEVVSGHDRALDLMRFANETGYAPEVLVQLAMVNADGRMVSSNLDPDGSKSRNVSLADREHFMVHAQPDQVGEARLSDPDALFISKPVLGKISKRWTIQLSRRVLDAEGRFKGVVVASLDPGYFESLFQRVELGPESAVTLVGLDRALRARVLNGKPSDQGSVLAKGGGFDLHGRQIEGFFPVNSSLDRIDRLVAYRRVGPFPLVIMVSTATDSALAEWYQHRRLLLGLGAMLTLTIVLGTAVMAMGLRRISAATRAMQESERQAQLANQAKSEFLTAISHELRTPLTGIRGFAEIMEQRIEDPKFKRHAGLIRKGAEHLTALLTEILDFSKVESGLMELVPEPVDLHALIQGTVDFFAIAAQNKELVLHKDVGPDVPEFLTCDGLRLKQVLNNLLANAIKFTQEGSVTLKVERRAGALAFQVIDTGPGIPLDAQARIFEKFRQGHAKVSSEHGGTGLGLALSRGLAELMGGTLSVNSDLGRGASFTLLLPHGELGRHA